MDVPPHPHTGLQTVSWLFTGEIEHRDSLGSHALVRPGELNLMTGGRGIAHSEVSTPDTTAAARRAALGGAARRATATPARTSSTTSPAARTGRRRVGRACSSARWPGSTSPGDDVHARCSARSCVLDAGRRGRRSPSTRRSSTACSSTAATLTLDGHRGAAEPSGLPAARRDDR